MFFLITGSAYGDNKYSSIKRFSVKDGLPDNTIYHLAQDNTGFLWLGTPSGLVSYDGHEFKKYSNEPTSTYPLAFSGGGEIFIDSKNRFWISSWGEGLAVYSNKMILLRVYTKKDFKHPNSNSTIMSLRISGIFEDSDGDIWIGTRDKGFALVNPETKSFKNYSFNVEKSDNSNNTGIWSIVETQPGTLWIATDNGLYKFDKNTESLIRYYHDPSNPASLNHSLIRTLHVVKNNDTTNTLWVGTEKGLGVFDPESEKFHAINPKNSPINQTTTKIIQDSDNHLWIGTKIGLYKYDLNNNKFVTFSNKNNYRLFVNDDIRDLYIDSTGLLWLATRYTGLIKVDLKPNKFENLYQYQDQSKNKKVQNLSNIQAVYIDSENVLWLASKDGLFYRNNDTGVISRFMPSNELTQDNFRTIVENKSGELWLGGHGGLYKIDKQRKAITTQNKLLEKIKLKTIKTLMFDKEENLWVGTYYSGIVRIDKKLTTTDIVNDDATDAITNFAINMLYQDNFNRIWIATNFGIAILNPGGKFVHYIHDPKDEDSISAGYVSTVYQTQDGDIWIGTKHALNRYNETSDTFEHFNVTDGLANHDIKAIIEDDFGTLWLSTNTGISQLNSTRNNFINFPFKDELLETNFLSRSIYKGQEGSIYFGSNRGIKKITPAPVKLNKHIPSVVITDVWIDNELSNQEMIAQTQALNIDFGIKNIKFGFAAIDYQDPIHNLHSYRLVGFNNDWSKASNEREANYNNLIPGTYSFEVKGSNNSGLWNPEVTRLKFTINPPWWKSWWAYTIYVLILAGIVFALIRIQRNKILFERKLNLKLEQKIIERTAQLEGQKLAVEKKNREIVAKNLEVESKNEEILAQKLEVESKNEEILATQQQLVQSKKMAALGTLTAGISHEINTPIGICVTAITVLHEKIIEIKTAFDNKKISKSKMELFINNGIENIKLIDNNIQRTSELINKFKEIAVDQSDEEVHSFNLFQLLDKIIASFKSSEACARHEIILDCDINRSINSKRNTIHQIMFKLIENSLNHAFKENRQGTITIKSALSQKDCTIFYSDNGVGISDEFKRIIFDPFSTTNRGKGAGLGMHLVYNLVTHALNGNIEINDVHPRGVQFIITFPINHQPKADKV